MGRSPCCSKVGLHKGPWGQEEDALLINYIQCNGEGNWRQLPKNAGLLRCGKSCRLRWVNYLRPDIKRGNIGAEEEDLIIRLHSLLGNRWSLIAGRLPGRTDNEIKNYWNSHLSKTLDGGGGGLGLDLMKGSPRPAAKVRNASKRSAKKPEKLEIYAPKPIRPSLNPNFSAELTVGESSDCTNKTTMTMTTEEETMRDVNYHGRWFDEADSNVNNFDSNMNFEVDWLQENSLETVYDDYLQLLNSDGDYFQMIPMDYIMSPSFL